MSEHERRTRRTLFIGGVVFTFYLAFTFNIYCTAYTAWQSLQAPPVSAEVTDISWTWSADRIKSGPNAGQLKNYDIHYKFNVGGQIYESAHFYGQDWHSLPKNGTLIKIHYNPQNPKETTLLPEQEVDAAKVAGLVGLAIFVCFVIEYLTSKKQWSDGA